MDINLFENHERDALNYQIRQQRMSFKDSTIELEIDKSSRQAITRSLNNYFSANGLNAKESWFIHYDKKIGALFHLNPKKDVLTYFNMQRYIQEHVQCGIKKWRAER